MINTRSVLQPVRSGSSLLKPRRHTANGMQDTYYIVTMHAMLTPMHTVVHRSIDIGIAASLHVCIYTCCFCRCIESDRVPHLHPIHRVARTLVIISAGCVVHESVNVYILHATIDSRGRLLLRVYVVAYSLLFRANHITQPLRLRELI